MTNETGGKSQGVIWGVLALLLILGTVASAYVVWGLTLLTSTRQWWPWALVAIGASVLSIFLFLLLLGVLYRLDRVRGVLRRRIALFE